MKYLFVFILYIIMLNNLYADELFKTVLSTDKNIIYYDETIIFTLNIKNISNEKQKFDLGDFLYLANKLSIKAYEENGNSFIIPCGWYIDIYRVAPYNKYTWDLIEKIQEKMFGCQPRPYDENSLFYFIDPGNSISFERVCRIERVTSEQSKTIDHYIMKFITDGVLFQLPISSKNIAVKFLYKLSDGKILESNNIMLEVTSF